MADENTEVEIDTVSSDEEKAEATALGWSDKDKWRGSAESWVDAKTFLEKGRPVLAVLKQTNASLRGELEQSRAKMSSLESSLQAANASIAALQEAHDADVKEQVEAARRELREEIARASREGDHEALASATEKMVDLNAAAKEAEKKDDDKSGKGDKGDKDGKDGAKLDPAFIAWAANNTEWLADPANVALSTVAGHKLRSNGDTSKGAEFLDKVAAEVDKMLGRTGRAQAGKVSGGNGGTGRGGNTGGGGGKTYADLPAEAKAVCDRQGAKLVGPNRIHKTIDSWRASYAKQYFAE